MVWVQTVTFTYNLTCWAPHSCWASGARSGNENWFLERWLWMISLALNCCPIPMELCLCEYFWRILGNLQWCGHWASLTKRYLTALLCRNMCLAPPLSTIILWECRLFMRCGCWTSLVKEFSTMVNGCHAARKMAVALASFSVVTSSILPSVTELTRGPAHLWILKSFDF